MGVLDNLGINLGYLIIQILGFIILFLAIKGYATEPITRILEERKAKIAKGLEDARQAAIARDNADAEAKKILDAARAEAAKIRQDAAVQAEETAKGIRSQAQEEARSIVSGAQEEAEGERNRILADLRGQVASISIAAADKLVRNALTDDARQRALINDFFAKSTADISNLTGDKAEVTSALPLTEAEQQQVRNTLNVSNVNFRVDPSILGGLKIRVGDQLVDDSVASRMNAMRSSLN